MHLLVTRPAEDARATAAQLRALGHEVSLDPLLDIQWCDAALPLPSEVQALLVTSANGLRALMARGPIALWWQVRVFAVGATTAELARRAGFAHVYEASGDVSSLVALVAKTLPKGQGDLLHLSGKVTAGDLQGGLSALGYTVRRVVLYDAVAAVAFSPLVEEALRAGDIDGVLIYSRRSGEIFKSLVLESGLQSMCSGLRAYCLSDNAATALRDLDLKQVQVARTLTESAFFALLGP